MRNAPINEQVGGWWDPFKKEILEFRVYELGRVDILQIIACVGFKKFQVDSEAPVKRRSPEGDEPWSVGTTRNFLKWNGQQTLESLARTCCFFHPKIKEELTRRKPMIHEFVRQNENAVTRISISIIKGCTPFTCGV